MTTRGVGLVILLLSLFFSSGCIGVKAQNDVLLPAMETAWNGGLGLEAQRGGAPPGMILEFERALVERKRLAVIAQWPPIDGYVTAGIKSQVSSGEISPGVAYSLRLRQNAFSDAVTELSEALYNVE